MCKQCWQALTKGGKYADKVTIAWVNATFKNCHGNAAQQAAVDVLCPCCSILISHFDVVTGRVLAQYVGEALDNRYEEVNYGGVGALAMNGWTNLFDEDGDDRIKQALLEHLGVGEGHHRGSGSAVPSLDERLTNVKKQALTNQIEELQQQLKSLESSGASA
jgi:hypothetical protein